MVKKDVLEQMLIDNQIEIGDVVKVGYKSGYNGFGIVISVNPLKIFSGINNTTERISCADLETITKSFKPTMSEFYALAEGEYSIFVNLYERFPFDLN